MLNLHSILVIVLVSTFTTQPVVASSRFNEEEMAACIPVGKIAIIMKELQDKGLKKKFIETALIKQLDERLSFWVIPISKSVFSAQKKSSKKVVVKQAIGYCLNIMKSHKKTPTTVYIDLEA